jgi:hypothetical protein
MIRRGIAQRVEKLSAAARMPPALGVNTLGIGAHVQEFRPRLIVEIGGLRGPYQVSLPAMSELYFRTIAAKGAGDEQHGDQ